MGSNRIHPVSATMPSTMQTHSPSGSSNPPMSSSIKTEHSADLDVAMTVHCRSENWAESYQDLSSWCSATSASSPAICPSPVTDEAFVSDFDFQGEIDFDLRKSEEIASIPLEEDTSFNVWGSGSPLLGDVSSPPPPVLADSSAEKPKSVLLKDCWWSEIERGKVVKELESSRQRTLTTATSSIKNNCDDIPSPIVVKEEVIDTKENMNPVSVPPTPDPVKVVELLSKFGITRATHPDIIGKEKVADLLRILQDQIVASNKKKYRSPAAVSDLHNYSKVLPGPSTSSETRSQQSSQAVVTSLPVMFGSADYVFESSSFGASIPMHVNQMQQSSYVEEPNMSTGNLVSHQVFRQNEVAASGFASNNFHSFSDKSMSQSSVENGLSRSQDLFVEAHHEIMRGTTRPQHEMSQQPAQLQQPLVQLPVIPEHNFTSQAPSSSSSSIVTNPAPNCIPDFTSPLPSAVKKEKNLSVRMPSLRMDLDLNFDMLFPGVSCDNSKNTSISTPEVLKPLVETPTEGFDLLSYLCDDKPINFDNNPFHFPQPNSSHSIATPTSSTFEHKPNVMVVKPLTPVKLTGTSTIIKTEQKDEEDSSVKMRPHPLVDVEVEKDGDAMTKKGVTETVKEERISPRPSRSNRKRKYSDDEFVLSPSSSEENLKSSRRRRTTSSKYDSDEDFTLPSLKSRKKSVSTIVEEEEEDDEDEEEKKPKKTRASPSVRQRTLSSTSDTDRYRELRDRNNEASRKSRLTRKAREQELGRQAEDLVRENRILKVKVEEMENLVKKLREALLQSMMKKS